MNAPWLDFGSVMHNPNPDIVAPKKNFTNEDTIDNELDGASDDGESVISNNIDVEQDEQFVNGDTQAIDFESLLVALGDIDIDTPIFDSTATKKAALAQKVTDIIPNVAKLDRPDEWSQLSFN